MILFIMNNNSPDNNHDNSTNEIMRIFFFGHQSLKNNICQRAQGAYCFTGNRFFQAVVIMNVKMTKATKCSFVIQWSNH